jgi:hypothetical protein
VDDAAELRVIQMTFLARPASHRSAYADALETWRTSAHVASDRWHQFKAAERASRPFMFAAYVAALDREEAAAAELASMTLAQVA